MPATKTRKKPIRLNAVQQFQLTGIVLGAAGWKISSVINAAKDKGISQVNENHVRGVAKSHGIELALKTRGASPKEKAEKCRVAYIEACSAADVDHLDFLPSGTVPLTRSR